MIVCPPALKCLVYLWDQLSSNCIQVVQSAASDLLKDIHNPNIMANHRNDQNICDDSKKIKKKKKGMAMRESQRKLIYFVCSFSIMQMTVRIVNCATCTFPFRSHIICVPYILAVVKRPKVNL